MCQALCRTVEEDLQKEVEFLPEFDRARTRLNDIYDWPGQSPDLFFRVVHQNDNKLSKSNRGSHFDWMTDKEIRISEAVVRAEIWFGRQKHLPLQAGLGFCRRQRIPILRVAPV